jgi:hypothetical protein
MYLALAILLFQLPAAPQAATPHTQQTAKRDVQLASAIAPDSSAKSLTADSPAPATNPEPANGGEKPSAAAQPADTAATPDAELAFLAPGSSSTELAFAVPAASPAIAPLPVAKMSPFIMRRSEAPTPKMWYGLTAASHAAATFDAWSTRRVISSGVGHELNPLLRPFASSNGLYAAIQVGPSLFDLLGKRMASSQRPWVHKMWWVPQVAGTASSFLSGVHNVHVYHQAVAGYPQQ